MRRSSRDSFRERVREEWKDNRTAQTRRGKEREQEEDESHQWSRWPCSPKILLSAEKKPKVCWNVALEVALIPWWSQSWVYCMFWKSFSAPVSLQLKAKCMVKFSRWSLFNEWRRSHKHKAKPVQSDQFSWSVQYSPEPAPIWHKTGVMWQILHHTKVWTKTTQEWLSFPLTLVLS